MSDTRSTADLSGHQFSDDLFGTYTVESFHAVVDDIRLWNVRTPEGWQIHMAEEAIPQ